MKFSPEQLQVVNLNAGWHSCLAPAGSGKTEILTERVSRAIESGQDPKSMICLTFTNRAARSMAHRIEDRLGESASGIFIGNTHAYALSLLEKNWLLPPTSTLSDEDTVERLWDRGIKNSALVLLKKSPVEIQDRIYQLLDRVSPLNLQPEIITEENVRNAHLRITAAKYFDRWNLKALMSLIQPLLSDSSSKLSADFIGYIKERIFVLDSNITPEDLPFAIALALDIFEYYENEKQIFNLYDFDDLLIKAWESLNSGQSLKMGSFQWCQIDEVQDLSPIQWLIIRSLLSEDAHVLLLGDIRQSIYRFLGASIEVTSHNLGDSVFQLTKNYRSPANLVSMADRYCEHHFGQRMKTESNKPAKDSALIHIQRESIGHHDSVLIKHAKKLIENNKSVAFLCPTNNMVESYSDNLSKVGLNHFKIGSKDLLSSQHGLDFMSFLGIIYNPNNKLAWSRLLWRFGNLDRMSLEERNGYEPQIASMKLAAQLGAIGCNLHDFLGKDTPFEYFLRTFTLDVEGATVYFDTETTGLSPIDDAIIQLAGVKLKSGEVCSEIDLYCSTDKPLGDSVKIHHIDEKTLNEKGQPIHEQLKKFLSYSQNSVLVAHNLPFDDGMLKSHIKKWSPNIYSEYTSATKYCSLDIARRLYPELKKHKLGYLLEEFGLEGVNSHNALDDVKAGANLMIHLREEALTRLELIDSLITPYSKSIQRFSEKFFPLLQKVEQIKEQEVEVNIMTLFDLFFNHIREHKLFKLEAGQVEELGGKIGCHGLANFPPKKVAEFLDSCMPFYQTAKEADLITDNDKLVVSTIHRAKGLEFEHVILPQLVDGTVPNFGISKMLSDADPLQREEAKKLLDEQKRLTYVALTRATDQLVIGTYKVDPRGYSKDPSPFLSPIQSMFRIL